MVSHSPRIPKIKECIKYIESCGWTLDYYNRPWYCFKINPGWFETHLMKQVSFTLHEIRDAYTNGW